MKNVKSIAGFLFALVVGSATGFSVSAALIIGGDFLPALLYLAIGFSIASIVPNYFVPGYRVIYNVAAVLPFSLFILYLVILLVTEGSFFEASGWLGLSAYSILIVSLPGILQNIKRQGK